MNKETARLVIDAIILPIISAAVFVLWDLNKSVALLNTQVGVLLSTNQSLEKRVEKLESRVYGN